MLHGHDSSTDLSEKTHKSAWVYTVCCSPSVGWRVNAYDQNRSHTGMDVATLRTEVDLQAQKLRQSGKECCSAASYNITHTKRMAHKGGAVCISLLM